MKENWGMYLGLIMLSSIYYLFISSKLDAIKEDLKQIKEKIGVILEP